MALMKDDVKKSLFPLLATKPRFDVKGNSTPSWQSLVVKTEKQNFKLEK